MRRRKDNKNISVHAISGSYVILLGFDATGDARKGLLGFGIQRTDHTEDEKHWLKGLKTFKELVHNASPGQLVSTREHPVQAFLWGDYTAKPQHKYTYKVVPFYGTPGGRIEGEPVEVTISTEDEDHGVHAVYFNRGTAGSQAYMRKFGDAKPDSVEARKWLSRGLEEAMLDFIHNAKGEEFALRAAVYEFSHLPALKAFGNAAKSGADVKIVCDARKDEPYNATKKAVKEAGIEDLMIKRTANPSYISHNKFIILLKVEDGEGEKKKLRPVEVWTGSTNYTAGGLYGQSNVGHIVRDHHVAEKYYGYWRKLAENPELKEFRPWNKEHTPVPGNAPPPDSITPVFSPRPTIHALEWYAEQMDKALTGVNFTAAFGVNKLLVNVFQEDKEYLRYLILDNPGSTKTVRQRTEDIQLHEDNRVAIGAYLEEDTGELHQWAREKLTGLNEHVKYLHTKYMIIDALSDDPVLISGSANFSDNSTKNNDENMLIVRGNTRVADIYLGEFMRLFNHFYFRDVANRQAKEHGSEERESAYLVPDDSWTAPFYEQDSVKWKERLLFRGRKNTGHGITFFDIDETIFHTSALIWVMKDGEVVKKLDNQTYNTYKLEEGESFDFREFKDAEIFEKTSKIIVPTLKKIKAMMKNALRTGSKLALLTARSTFPDMATFKKTFRDYGIRIDKMDINFAGDISAEAGGTAAAKKQIVLKYLSHGEYKRARLLDDNMENLKAFLSIAKDMPGVEFTALHIDKNGKTKTIKPKKRKK